MPWGFIPIGIFFVFGATMTAYAAITLAWPGTPLDALWALNKEGQRGLAELGRIAAVPFVFLSVAMTCAAVGWLRRRKWGWVLGVTIISINMAGDVVQVALMHVWKGLVGVVIAGAVLGYMVRPRVREYFR